MGDSLSCLLGAGLSVASLLHGQAVFAESVSGQGLPQFWVGHGCQVFCHSVVSVEGQKASQLTLVFVDSFQCTKYFSFGFLIIWFCLMCWLLRVGQSPRISQLRGHFSGCYSLWVVVECVAVAFLKVVIKC